MSDLDPVASLECILFVAEGPVSRTRLAQVLQVEMETLDEWVARLRHRLAAGGLQILEIAGGLRLMTCPQYAPVVESFLTPPPVKLSQAALETLAIVAYRQPITRPEIEAIRGVNSHAPLKTLLGHGLLVLQGRKAVPGRPLQYGTGDRFLDFLGLDDLGDLPPLEEDLKLELTDLEAGRSPEGKIGT